MFRDILNNIIWLDILMGGIVLRCLFIGATRGLVVEILKLIGVLVAVFITQHYFVSFARFLHEFVAAPEFMAEILAFVVLWIIVVVLFKFLREGITLFLKKKDISNAKRWLGGLLGISRGVLICSLLFPLIFLTGSEYLNKTARSSFTGFYIVDLAPRMYSRIFDDIIKIFFPKEEKNNDVLNLKNIDQRKSRQNDKTKEKH